MQKVNRGKQFETQIRKAFEKVENTSVDRLVDQMNGYAGSSNICDFIVYNKPMLMYLECKCCYGNTLPFSNITDTQWRGLLSKAKIPGVKAGYMIWFIDHDLTVYIPANIMKKWKDEYQKKSVNVKDLVNYHNCVVIDGTKKRLLFDYDMKEFIGYLGASNGNCL